MGDSGSGSSRRTRRARTRRSLPPRPPASGGVVQAPPANGGTEATRRVSASERFVARETVYLATEIRRIFAVSGICLLLLAALVVVDRVS